MKIYSLTNYILFTTYLYLYIPKPIYVISYVIHKIIKNNFINFASGICCLIYLDQINLTLTQLNYNYNYNYLIYGISRIMLYLSFIEIYCNVFLAGFKIFIELIEIISKKIVCLSINLNLNVSAFEHIIMILDGTLNSIILISNHDERQNIYDKLKFIFNKILQRIIQIEIQNTLEDNQINGRIDERIDERIDGRIDERVDERIDGRIDGETNTFESFVEQLNITYPLRCRGLENNDNQDERNDSNVCNICLEDLNYNQLYRTINCSHSFHPHCVDRWLFQSKLCPICRYVINLDNTN